MKRQGTIGLLLAVSLFMTTQSFPVFAETISENAVNVEEESKEGKDNGEREKSGEEALEGSIVLDISQEMLLDSNVSENSANTGAGTPANPVHHCTMENDGTDYTDFSYVYFGSYPQSEVMDSATIAAIEKAISKSGTDADAGKDVWVNGVKYRRISKSDVPPQSSFGSSTYRYFKWERIRWKVLQNDGNTLFVVADKALDNKHYDNKWGAITWKSCTIRNWLNESFYSAAFNSSEREAIAAQSIVDEGNPYWDISGGENTEDKVYLLSVDEVTNETYGFCRESSVFSMSRKTNPSGYANARGLLKHKSDGFEGYYSRWWLRTPGYHSGAAATVLDTGLIDGTGLAVDGISIGEGVCPALHIKLSSDFWYMTDDGTSGEGGEDGKDGKDDGIKVEKLSVTAPSKKLAAGKKVRLSLKVTPENATNKAVTWKTSNGKYATVDQNGKVTLKKAGAGKNVVITATAKDGSKKKATIKIKIMKHAVNSIKLKAPAKNLVAGKSMTIKATVTATGKSANKTLKWKSSNTKYATVNKKGKVTAKKAGKNKTVTITAASIDGSNKKAKVKIKIK